MQHMWQWGGVHIPPMLVMNPQMPYDGARPLLRMLVEGAQMAVK